MNEPAWVNRYRSVIEATLARGALPALTDAPPARLAVERGVAWPLLAESPGSAAAFDLLAPMLSAGADPEAADVVDRAGHARPAYRGLLCYAMFQAVRASDRVLLDAGAVAAVRWLETLAAEVTATAGGLPAGGIPADRGGEVAGMCWAALAVHAGGELLHEERPLVAAGRAVRAVVARQRPAGGYLVARGSDNPETLWFHELQVAHAVASYAMQAGDPVALDSAVRAARFHMNETQPDHATNQPWGLSAFLADAGTHVMADGQLHAANVQQPERVDGASLILLSDALYSVRRRRAR